MHRRRNEKLASVLRPAGSSLEAVRKPLRAGEIVMRRLDELAQFSSDPNALTRLYLTPEHKAAVGQVMAWMREAGMEAEIDAVGNVVGRYEGRRPDVRTLLIGSHIDTVGNAGKYDGSLGVIVGIQAVAELHARGERLPFAIEILAFGDEEGVRFPVTLTGSRAIAGVLDSAVLDVEDENGVNLREALQSFGCNPSDIPKVARSRERVLGYIEVHIEQGPVLEKEGLPVGVVTAINGASRLGIEVAGEAGHAGTVPMRLRKDAVAAAAEMVRAVESLALETEDLVATVGRIEAFPGAVNVIASQARFTLDIRSPSDDVRQAALDALVRAFHAIAERRGLELSIERFYDEPAAACAAWMMRALEDSVVRLGFRPMRLPSGAGHDGLAMISLCPIGMLFVRCKGGVSHNPAESITADDADVATRVLLDFLRHLDPARVGH
jgi:allantoate deiminase